MVELPKLDYEYNALEPHIDEQTMTIHHTKHHQGYTDKYNAAVEGTDLADKDPIDVIKDLGSVSEDIKGAIQNNGGGFVNHALFWKVMSPNGGGEPSGKLKDAINAKFQSFDKFKEEFSNAALTVFGSGWGWLVLNKEGALEILTTPNQNSPISEGHTPLLGIDMWEHAFYLKVQNKKNEYVDAWWNVVNWNYVNELFEKEK